MVFRAARGWCIANGRLMNSDEAIAVIAPLSCEAPRGDEAITSWEDFWIELRERGGGFDALILFLSSRRDYTDFCSYIVYQDNDSCSILTYNYNTFYRPYCTYLSSSKPRREVTHWLASRLRHACLARTNGTNSPEPGGHSCPEGGSKPDIKQIESYP